MEQLLNLFAYLIRALSIAIIARAIFSFIVPMLGERPHPVLVSINSWLSLVTEPVLGPIRRVLPTFGMLDLSPVVAIIVLEVIHAVLLRSA